MNFPGEDRSINRVEFQMFWTAKEVFKSYEASREGEASSMAVVWLLGTRIVPHDDRTKILALAKFKSDVDSRMNCLSLPRTVYLVGGS